MKHQRHVRISVVLPAGVELLVGTDDDPNEGGCSWEILGVLSVHCDATPRSVEENMHDLDFEALVAATAKAENLPGSDFEKNEGDEKHPPMLPSTIHNDPEGGPILRRVEETFAAFTKARNRQNRVSRPEAVKAAGIEYKAAEEAYRLAADARDRFVEIWNARKMQREDLP